MLSTSSNKYMDNWHFQGAFASLPPIIFNKAAMGRTSRSQLTETNCSIWNNQPLIKSIVCESRALMCMIQLNCIELLLPAYILKSEKHLVLFIAPLISARLWYYKAVCYTLWILGGLWEESVGRRKMLLLWTMDYLCCDGNERTREYIVTVVVMLQGIRKLYQISYVY